MSLWNDMFIGQAFYYIRLRNVLTSGRFISSYSLILFHYYLIANMVSKRVYACDYGKGLAILGMLLAHTFEAGICDWNHDIELHYIQRIPIAVIVVLAPLALICLMGLFFTFITSMTCTMNIIRIESKGKGAVMSYFLYRFAFAIVLKFVEIFFKNWWQEYGIFQTMSIRFPQVELGTDGGTLDSIGACGLLVPVSVYLVRRIPWARKDYKRQVVILSAIAVLLLFFYLPIADFFVMLAEWLFKYEFNFLGIICSKFGKGSFMIAQCFPFGLVGGCIAIIMVSTKLWKPLWIYASSMMGIAVAVAILYLVTDPDPFNNVLSYRKPSFVRFCELGFECLVIVFASHLSDNESRPLLKRYQFNKHVTFLRRISCVSLSCYIWETWVSRQIRKFFIVVVGFPYDLEKKESLWSFWAVGVFMIVNLIVDLYIITFWEKIQFRFSSERTIAWILSWLFNRKEEVDWKASNQKIIYGPINELEKEIIESDETKAKKNLSTEVQMVEVDMGEKNPETTDAPRRTQIGNKQEIQLMSTLIEANSNIVSK
ncbi:uncharacterized protein [Blastocystis hominis]|uniref:Acyltransferase 3 domain-containing protein n=1 Tax=Blastocystis hominis TaxID=12968 RepID=D8M695_BLAHO|nr:uncharacterized protein [Blastocystis hominis]CBK23648.2 unnamed protein product [Blastocystis hominis]|eukprot:XP_012897696.1 uncharacterized protein [Blastocystis hominis]